ncbi:hypothetical protein [Kitasatospora sp. NPDC088346]|uniref:hypothetical protein n=1 Tax=Kitasatospora sp. NPDC088346 TaxID=3364073 RepID=UPI0038101B00
MIHDRATALDELVTDQRFGADELPVLRAVVTHCATLAGAGIEYRDLLVFAVHEVAESIATDPGPEVRVVISRPDDTTLVCRIAEDGTGRPANGTGTATRPGRGVGAGAGAAAGSDGPRLRWSSGELSECLRIDTRAGCTTVTLSLPDDRPAARPVRSPVAGPEPAPEHRGARESPPAGQ